MAILTNENKIHHGVLFVQDENGQTRLVIPLQDIFCVYYKGDKRNNWIKGCFVQFYDRDGTFYRDEDIPTRKYGDRVEYKGSIAIVEIELPDLSVKDVCRAMVSNKYDETRSFDWAAYFTFNIESVKKIAK